MVPRPSNAIQLDAKAMLYPEYGVVPRLDVGRRCPVQGSRLQAQLQGIRR